MEAKTTEIIAKAKAEEQKAKEEADIKKTATIAADDKAAKETNAKIEAEVKAIKDETDAKKKADKATRSASAMEGDRKRMTDEEWTANMPEHHLKDIEHVQVKQSKVHKNGDDGIDESLEEPAKNATAPATAGSLTQAEPEKKEKSEHSEAYNTAKKNHKTTKKHLKAAKKAEKVAKALKSKGTKKSSKAEGTSKKAKTTKKIQKSDKSAAKN